MNTSTDIDKAGLTGLDELEAAQCSATEGPNALADRVGNRWAKLLWSVVAEPMFLMLLLAAGIYIVLGDRGEAFLLLGSVVIVISITAVQEVRAYGALRALRELAAPVAHVVRSGRERPIPAPQVVRGDLLVLREGDRVAADGRMVEGTLILDESLLTGESVPVQRTSGVGDVTVHAGTLVVGGQGRIVVIAIGAATAIGAIGLSLVATESIPSRLQRAGARAVRRIAIVAVGLAVLLVLVGWWVDHLSPLAAILGGIALAMAILPEEVPVVLAVFYALGARRIARKGVLTRRLAAVEAVGTLTLLAVDKTGTLTQNRMTLGALCDASGIVQLATSPLAPAGIRLFEAAVAATPPDSIDPTDTAVLTFEGYGHTSDLPQRALLREFPVGNGRSYMSRVYAEAEQGSWCMATKGSPEVVLGLCELPPDVVVGILALVTKMAADGFRVLAVAGVYHRKGPAPIDPSKERHEWLGLIGLVDPLRADVGAAISECHAAGIRVVMLTGDHPSTAAVIARQAGIPSEHVLLGSDIDRLSDDALAMCLRDVNVCARLQPSQKLRLVIAFQRAGHIIGMTGDGVNDAPALRAADVGVAMGARGSDVAREAADLVLMDDSFSALVEAIRLGRRIYDNVHRAIGFITAAHVPIVMLALFPLLMRWPPLLLPAQIVLLEMVIDPACSIVFEASSAAPDVMKRPPRRLEDTPFSMRNIGRGLLRGLGVGTILVTGYALPTMTSIPFAALGLPVFLSLLACTVTLVFTYARGARGAGVDAYWGPAIVLFAMAIGGAVAGIPTVRQVMGFDEPTWLAVLLPPVSVGLTLGWVAFSLIFDKTYQEKQRIIDP